MKGNILIDFLIRNGYLPNNIKKPVLAPVPVKGTPKVPGRKSN
ncbi:MAG TPA: hypothetical protein VHA56_14410 [Mucilaginibacter sp.]|nr:hypothetical protein [Mucilaginibacter sp.]